MAIEENTPSLRKNTHKCIHKGIYPSKTNPVSEYRQTGAYIHVYICGHVYMNVSKGMYESIGGKEVQTIRHLE